MASTLYRTLGSGNSFQPALVPGQTERACKMRRADVLGGETRRSQYLAKYLPIDPRGQVPFRVTADGRGTGESDAIAWLLAERTPLLPA